MDMVSDRLIVFSFGLGTLGGALSTPLQKLESCFESKFVNFLSPAATWFGVHPFTIHVAVALPLSPVP